MFRILCVYFLISLNSCEAVLSNSVKQVSVVITVLCVNLKVCTYVNMTLCDNRNLVN